MRILFVNLPLLVEICVSLGDSVCRVINCKDSISNKEFPRILDRLRTVGSSQLNLQSHSLLGKEDLNQSVENLEKRSLVAYDVSVFRDLIPKLIRNVATISIDWVPFCMRPGVLTLLAPSHNNANTTI